MDEILKSEVIFFNLLRQLLLKEPDLELLREIAEIKLDDCSGEDLAGLEMILKSVVTNQNRLEQWQEELASEFSRLFLGPAKPYAVPYASFYLSENHSLMTEETLNVRRRYLEAGWGVKNLHQIPDDHASIEFEFLYLLTAEIIKLHEEGHSAEAVKLLALRQAFLQEHMALWMPSFAQNIFQLTSEDFYKGIALFIKEIIAPYSQENPP